MLLRPAADAEDEDEDQVAQEALAGGLLGRPKREVYIYHFPQVPL